MSDTTNDELSDRLTLILVGADLRAERQDRPLAYRLREQMLRWCDASTEAEEIDAADARESLVCTDLWYLNNVKLHSNPAVSIGDPEYNAATAYLVNRLPVAFSVDETLHIQFDPGFADPRVCIWGADVATTVRGIDLFVARFLDPFLRSAHDLPIADI